MKKVEKYPSCFCPKCKKNTLIEIKTFKHKNTGKKINMGICPLCDTVLNLEEDIKVNWITKEKANQLGWYKSKN